MTGDRKPMPALRRSGGYWTCLWYDGNGKRRWKRFGSTAKVSRPEAEDRYGEFLEAWRRGQLDAGGVPGRGVMVKQFVDAYIRYAKGYYIDSKGQPTGEVSNLNDALKPLKKLYGYLALEKLRPRHIMDVQDEMLAADLARRTINDRIKRIRRAIRWAVVNDMAEPAVLEGIKAVEPLRYGRTTARETEPVKPVSVDHIRMVMRHVSPTIRAMINVQYRTGMRPQEVCNLRWADIDKSNDVWLFTPLKHKTQWKGLTRTVAIGPKAQRVLERYADVNAKAFIFSPRLALAELHAKRLTHRRQPNTKPKTDRQVGDCYITNSYRQAIQDACEKAGVPRWSPNQLRHALATRVRREFGIEFSQAVLGHQKIETTQIYAQQSMARAVTVMQEIG